MYILVNNILIYKPKYGYSYMYNIYLYFLSTMRAITLEYNNIVDLYICTRSIIIARFG